MQTPLQSFNVTVYVFIKPAVLNPEEKVVAGRLHDLGFSMVAKIRMGKCMILSLDAENEASAKSLVTKMSEKLLANLVVESFEIRDAVLIPPPEPAAAA